MQLSQLSLENYSVLEKFQQHDVLQDLSSFHSQIEHGEARQYIEESIQILSTLQQKFS